MAEFVEFRCEEWIEELDKLEKIRLFETKEIKSLINRRREFEYKLERRSKSKDDFLKYIQFEVDLLRIITARREKTGIKSNKVDIESKQIKRVIKLFKQVIFRHPGDVKLWMSLFKFCTDTQRKSIISKMLVRMLQYHTDKPELWIYASNWESNNGKSLTNARQFLLKALRHHPASDKIYIELFKLELRQMQKKIKLKTIRMSKNKWEPNPVAENIISGKVVEVVYKSSIKAISNAEFKADLLEVARNFPIATAIEDIIFRDLIELHPNDEVTWDVVAKSKYKGIKCDCSKLLGENNSVVADQSVKENENDNEKDHVRLRIEECVDVYEKAVKRLNTCKMWKYYLDHVISMFTNPLVKTKVPIFKNSILQKAMEGASEAGHLSEEYFLTWIESVQESNHKNKQVEHIMSKGIQLFPKSLPLWHNRLRYHLILDEEKEGKAVFEEAIEHFNNEGSELWELMIEYYKLKKSPDIEETFKSGLERRGEVAQMLKPKYLEWLAANKGIGEARKVFEKSDFSHPPDLDLFNTMLKLEMEQEKCDKERVRKCYDIVSSSFGRNDPKVWLDFIRWEKKSGDAIRMHQIHRRALNALAPEKADEFIEEYNFIKTDSS